MAVGRYGRMLDNRSDAHICLASDATTKRINRIAGFPSPPLITSEYPMELRVYRVGAGMDWHVDDCLFDRPQCEVVLVLENTSDSFTEFIDADGVLHSEWTPPNSALLVRAGGAWGMYDASRLEEPHPMGLFEGEAGVGRPPLHALQALDTR